MLVPAVGIAAQGVATLVKALAMVALHPIASGSVSSASGEAQVAKATPRQVEGLFIPLFDPTCG